MALMLKRQMAKVAHLNVREEKHGEEPVLAVDIKLEVDLANEFLDQLGEGLKAALYRPDEEQLAGVEVPMSVLRFPALEPLRWGLAIPGCDLTLHGASKTYDLTFRGRIQKAVSLEPKEGGTVATSFQVQVNPSPEQMAPLSALLGHSTKVTVKPVNEPLEAGGEDSTSDDLAQQGGGGGTEPPEPQARTARLRKPKVDGAKKKT